MSYRTTVYFPDDFKELLEARPDVNVSEICRKAVSDALGFSDVTSLNKKIKNQENSLNILKSQREKYNQEILKPENKMLLAIKDVKSISRTKLVSSFGNAAVISLVQKNLLIPDPIKDGHMTLTLKGKLKAKALEGKA